MNREGLPVTTRSLSADRLDDLFTALTARGYRCVAPKLGDGAIIYGEVDSSSELPRGWTDEQGPGKYRLTQRQDSAFFGYVVGPHSWKKYVFPSERRLWKLRRSGGSFERCDDESETPKYAFIGVRACEIAALKIQDRVFSGGRFTDQDYTENRSKSFIVAVNCTQSAQTCFCVAMKSGPSVKEDYDLTLTEVVGAEHYFLMRAGSDRGRQVLENLDTTTATAAQLSAAAAAEENAVTTQQRTLNTDGIRELLRDNSESHQWQEIAERCLSCANCTMVCPTCFCSTVEDITDLTGEVAERWRRWDSCFNPDFSYIHGGEVRKTTASRYRQWMTHKLSTWFDQFGTSGCVGCGRCIAWCPVGIDITVELGKMREGADT